MVEKVERVEKGVRGYAALNFLSCPQIHKLTPSPPWKKGLGGLDSCSIARDIRGYVVRA